MLNAGWVIDRAAYRVKDPFYKIINRRAALVDLEDIYRSFCRKTKILNYKLGINLKSGIYDYPLRGVKETGGDVGSDIHRLYRAEFNGRRSYELSYEDILNMRMEGSSSRQTLPSSFAVKYLQGSYNLMFPFEPGEGDKFVFWYHAIPPAGSVVTKGFDYEFAIDEKYIEWLSIGLSLSLYDLLMAYHTEQKNIDMVKYVRMRMLDVQPEWRDAVEDAKRDALGFIDTNTPIVAQAASITTFPSGRGDMVRGSD